MFGEFYLDSVMRHFFFFFLLFPIHCFGEEWKINTDHSEIFFKVDYLNISQVTGRFNGFAGSAMMQKSDPDKVLFEINSSTIETGNRLRDGHLKSGQFLKSKEFPVIIFKSQSVTKMGPKLFKAIGQLTMAGVTKKHSLEFSITEAVKDTWSYASKFVTFSTIVNRKDYGLVWNKTLSENKYLVGDKITIWGTLQLQPSASKTPSSKHMIPDTGYIRKRERMARGEVLRELPEAAFNPEKLQVSPQEMIPPTPEVKIEVPCQKDFRQDMIWRISFWTLGLMGFFASVIIGLYTKKIVSDKYPKAYREGGRLGLMSDSITIIFILVYCLALWEVGWG
jgi:polyisoprenoid-binding protein YceI